VAKDLLALHQERGLLLERITHQRSTLANELAGLQQIEQTGMRVAGLVQRALLLVRQNPVPVAVGVAALVVWRPVRVWRWTRRSLWLWRKWLLLRQLAQVASR
jgi:hypothetical protein